MAKKNQTADKQEFTPELSVSDFADKAMIETGAKHKIDANRMKQSRELLMKVKVETIKAITEDLSSREMSDEEKNYLKRVQQNISVR